MGFILLNRRNKLIILVPIRYTAADIRGNIVYIAFKIKTCKIKSLYTDVSRI